nr:pyruvate, phosphate dikinase regulatory protein, chloroplastic [Tanacetum cinerariifolium]
MELAVEQHCEEKTKVQIKMENVLQENDRLLTQALSVEIVNIVVHDNMKTACLNVIAYARCVTTESELKTDFLKNECYDTLLQKYNTLEKHLILKLKEKLNSLNGDVKDRNVKRDVEEIKTLNIELDHKVTKLAAENEHLKQIYKQLYDSIKSSRVRSKEQSLKEQLNKLKGKAVLTEAVSLNPIDPELLKLDVTPLVPKLRVNLVSSASGSLSQDNTKNNRIRQTQKNAKKNKVEDHFRIVKSSLDKASVVDSKATSSVLNSVSNVNSDLKCT